VQHGFAWNGTTYTTLDVPGASWTWAYGINNKGLMTVEWGDSAGNYEASYYDGKKYKTIDVPKAVNSYVHGIDSAGDVVYAWSDSTGLLHGALCTKCTSSGRKYYKFHDPKGPKNTAADGINDHKLISGNYIDNNDVGFGFKATY